MNWQDVLPSDLNELKPHLSLERAKINPQGDHLLLLFQSDMLVEQKWFLMMRAAFARAFPGARISLRVVSPTLADKVREDINAYVPFLIDCLTRNRMGARPWLADARWAIENDRISITVSSSIALDYVHQVQMDRQLNQVLWDVFRMKTDTIFLCVEDEQTRKEQLKALEEHALTTLQEQKKEELPKQETPAVEESPCIMGHHITKAIQRMDELDEQSGEIVVQGKVISVESRELKGNAGYILNFSLSDLTDSVTCKAFLYYQQRRRKDDDGKGHPPTKEEIAKVENILSAVKEGAYLTAHGSYTFDSYSHEMALILRDLERAEEPQRRDLSEEKRVELHMHTKMSDMDGVSSAADLIAQAAKWGHRAVAITDHGVGQAFPEAFGAAKKKGIKFIPGMEGYLVDEAEIVSDADDRPLLSDICVLDFETTGLSSKRDRVMEIGAVRLHNGQVLDELSVILDPQAPIPQKVQELTGITPQMVAGQKTFAEAADELLSFIGDTPLAAHNADFDVSFLKQELGRCGKSWKGPVIDTLAFARKAYPSLKSHKLGAVCKHVGVSLKNAHRAVHDARATALMLWKMLSLADEKGVKQLNELNRSFAEGAIGESYHIILLAATQDGLTNLNRIISEGHLNYFRQRPHLPRRILQKYREGLIIGSACEAGELFRAVLEEKDEQTLSRIARFYDYLEIQPIGNNAFLMREGRVPDEEGLRELNRKIVRLGEKCGLPVVATGDVHFLRPEDAPLRAILMAGKGFKDADQQAPLYFKTTDEMLEEFSYLGEEKCREVVITNPNKIADRIGEISLFPKHPEGKETFQPFWPEAADDIRDRSWNEAHRRYGENLPEVVKARLDKELGSIIGYGFATLYSIAQKLVAKSLSDGYLVGSRGSVGSSFVATMCGITEVNPLPPHYLCPNCCWSEFDFKHELATVGPDLPPKKCPVCGAECRREGFEIPFEVFLGFKGDKVPDIDLNFSGVYRPRAAKYVEELFGEGYVFRAGTIGSLAEKTAYGFVRKYFEERGVKRSEAEMRRLAKGCEGVRRTTGQHPGGNVVLPKGYSIYQFTAIQHPANDMESPIITTHYDFGSMHDVLVKLDLLGHDDPTMINMLEHFTGVNARELPLNDPGVMSLFITPKALGVTSEQIRCTTGTYGIPEFGTPFVRGMLDDTHPSTMEELIRISGLSHGTDVWLGNAADLVSGGIASLKECICVRDDIMNYLIMRGEEPKMAFTTMETVRKGKGLKPEMEEAMRAVKTPEWFIDSCKKIKYLFPKGHAVAYVTMALRVAWFKLYRPAAYYASYYTVRADTFDITLMSKSADELRAALDDFELRKNELTAAEQTQQLLAEIALEMVCRGIKLLPLDIYKSEAENFLLVDGNILPPFNAIPGLGNAAAAALVEGRKDGPYLSVEDFKNRTHASASTVDQLRALGALNGLAETSQVSLF